MAEGVQVASASKRERLNFISYLVRMGWVLFPKHGAEDLITQLVNFGTGHEDLADAFSLLLNRVREDSKDDTNAYVVRLTSDFYGARNSSRRMGRFLDSGSDWAEEEEDSMFPYLSSDRRWRVGS
jgi:hypothetical protein